MDYTKTNWIDGVTDNNASALNNIENGITNAKIEINSMTNIINKEKDIISWQNVVHDNNLNAMIIDTLLNIDNINTSSSTGILYQEYSLMTNSTATILWNAYTSDVVPTSAYVVADYSGTAPTISISRDGGISYAICTLNTLVDLSSLTSGQSIVLKLVLNDNTTVINAVGYGWKE